MPEETAGDPYPMSSGVPSHRPWGGERRLPSRVCLGFVRDLAWDPLRWHRVITANPAAEWITQPPSGDSCRWVRCSSLPPWV